MNRTSSKLIEMSPARFYTVTDVMKSVEPPTKEWLEKKAETLKELSGAVKEHRARLERSNRSMDSEIRSTVRRREPRTFDEAEDAAKEMKHSISHDTNFLRVAATVVSAIDDAYTTLYEMTRALCPGELIVTRNYGQQPRNYEEMQHMVFEIELNYASVSKFISAATQLDAADLWLSNFLRGVEEVLRIYHRALQNRHSTEGILVHGDPVLTDIAITIYENIDANGEIEDGRDPEQVSAYTVKKAEILTEALKDDFVHGLTERPDKLNDLISSSFLAMQTYAKELREKIKKQVDRIMQALGERHQKPSYSLAEQLGMLGELSPMTVVYRDRGVLLTAEERKNLEFKNQTISSIVNLIRAQDLDIKDVIQYVLQRKAQLRKFFMEENSFYVCRIGHGDPFLGKAPGALEVIPGTRPNVKLDDILGSGFTEVRQFADSIVQAAKWHDLFVATSPSKSADKSNVLLVGPMGCGKTEVMRAVGSDRGSIAISAQGSDFMTCWKGEQEKNPKRLFEQALRIQRDSRRHVHICIDEIDSVLNNDKDYGATNLTLEFQILMDGIVQYPGISVWGATNHVDRIPMPMIRRFSKVLVVGELSQEDRVKLLKAFVGFLPIGDITEDQWGSYAKRLDGATGDVMRKVADVIWREKMTDFVSKSPESAEKCVKFLSQKERFQIADFTPAQRQEFKRLLSNHVLVKHEDVDASVRSCLRNIGVLSEIETAKKTYSEARKYLAHLAASA